MNNVTQFPTEAEQQEIVRKKFNKDFKERWTKAAGGPGNFTGDIWAWETMLQGMGWHVNLREKSLQEFTTCVDFDNRSLSNNNVRAFHAHAAMDRVLQMLYADTKGRWLLEWKEVHDEAHKVVRDGEEYKGTDEYMSVWYTMDLFVREMQDGELAPLSFEALCGVAGIPVQPTDCLVLEP